MKLTLVVVLYNEKIMDSETIQSVVENQAFLKKFEHVHMIIYDNSPQLQGYDVNSFDFSFEYVHDSRNLGVREGYEYALNKAIQNSYEWLVLLDQDTNLTKDYFESLYSALEQNQNEFVCVVPKIEASGNIISPALNENYKLNSIDLVPGIQKKVMTGINSAASFNVEWLKKNGGFNKDFKLDYLDHWLFYQVYQTKNRIYLLDTVIQHDLSVLDYSQISKVRYESILESEYKYYKYYKKNQYSAYRRHLVIRLMKQILVVKDKSIAILTFKKLIKKG